MNAPLSLARPPTQPSSRSRGPTLRYRFSIASRVLAAIVGGYAFATVASVCVSRCFGLAPAEAVMTGLLVSFPIYAAAILWCFATRTAGRAWAGLLIATLMLGALAWSTGPGGAT